MKCGEAYDDFGKVWIVTRVRKREIDVRHDSFDVFGKNVPEYRTFHPSAFNVMRKVESSR